MLPSARYAVSLPFRSAPAAIRISVTSVVLLKTALCSAAHATQGIDVGAAQLEGCRSSVEQSLDYGGVLVIDDRGTEGGVVGVVSAIRAGTRVDESANDLGIVAEGWGEMKGRVSLGIRGSQTLARLDAGGDVRGGRVSEERARAPAGRAGRLAGVRSGGFGVATAATLPKDVQVDSPMAFADAGISIGIGFRFHSLHDEEPAFVAPPVEQSQRLLLCALQGFVILRHPLGSYEQIGPLIVGRVDDTVSRSRSFRIIHGVVARVADGAARSSCRSMYS